jgi:hypothetical protein
MAEFVVGQWVQDRDLVGKVEKITEAVYVKYADNECSVAYRRHDEWLMPFTWQVGKTYRTTLEGVTATIVSSSPASFGVNMSDKPGTVCVDRQTGQIIGMESRSDQPNLLPFLADEPSEVEAVKPQAPSPYDRVIGGVEVDLWTLADIYGITSHRLFSAWKKITMAGRRGPKDKLRDLREARVALGKEIAKLEAEGGDA